MTVATETAKRSFQLEYILAIEGVGWLVDETTYSSGFEGDVFVTADLNGDLASKLGCTIHDGMQIPGGISDKIDPRQATYELSGVGVDIEDVDDWWSANFTPHLAGNATTLSSSLDYNATSVVLTDATNYVEGDIAWLGGREAILLGTKAGSTFSSSTRGYLGTPRGSHQYDIYSATVGFAWAANTTVYDVHRFWYDRSMAIYAHVPGEAVANIYLLWFGRLRNVQNPQAGLTWKLSGTGDILRFNRRSRRTHDYYVTGTHNIDSGKEFWYDSAGTQHGQSKFVSRRVIGMRTTDDQLAEGDVARYVLPSSYHYRWEVGGTSGMKSAYDAGNLQAADIDNVTDVFGAFVKVGEQIYWGRRREHEFEGGADASGRRHWVVCDGWGYDESVTIETSGELPWLEDNLPIRFLLDSWPDNYKMNRYAVNRKVRRHPIDVFLCHLLTMNNEFFIDDAEAGSTTTTVDFLGPSWTTDQWIGYALFAVEDTNKYEARVITGNDSNSVTVSPAFSNTPTAGAEYQIRNSIYDVLPLGWGLGVPNWQVDIDAFEQLRDERLPDAETERFIIGMQKDLDLWSMFQKEILQPYGIILYMDGDTHKITPRYIGDMFTDGVLEDYTAITEETVLSFPQLDYQFSKPLGGFIVNVRKHEKRITGYESMSRWVNTDPQGKTKRQETIHRPTEETVPLSMVDGEASILVRSTEVEAGFAPTNRDLVEVSAMFNTQEGDSGVLIGRLIGLLKMYQIPPVVAHFDVDSSLITSIYPGQIVTIELTTWPVNPFAATRGWDTLTGRVIEKKLLSDRPGLSIGVELHQETPGGKICPAAITTAYDTDGSNYYIDLSDTNFVYDTTNDKDWYYFTNGDEIEIRSSTGAVQQSALTITGFGGASQAASQSTPSGATPSRIWVDATITATWASGDYITFDEYDNATATQTANFAFYADSSDLLGTINAAAKKYGL